MRVAISIVAAVVVIRIYNHWKEGRAKTEPKHAERKDSFSDTIADTVED